MKERQLDTGRADLLVELHDGDLPEPAYTHRLPIGKRPRGWARGPEIEVSGEAVKVLGLHGKMSAHSKVCLYPPTPRP